MEASTAALSLIEELHELSREADGETQALQSMLSHIVRSFGAQSGSLAVIDRNETSQLRIVAGIDLPSHVIGQTVQLGAGVLEQRVRGTHPAFRGAFPVTGGNEDAARRAAADGIATLRKTFPKGESR